MATKIYFTSDLHLDHANIIKYCNRPFADVHEMNEALINNWNERVTSGDRVYVLGDFALTTRDRLAMFRKRLKGTVAIIRGNHDRGPQALASCGFDLVAKELEMSHSDGTHLYLRHRPDVEWFPRFPKSYHLCGHVHEKWKKRECGKVINVGVDQWGFKPVTLEELLDDQSKDS